MNVTTKKVIRCAIYTRKSSEEGLEQDFNSLHAQREACEAYIKSQQHEGWILIDKNYDDGGFSGGTLERPALKELFQDLESGEIDIIVVYKVDRLTRSLMDFAKIVDLFDKYSTSFVSITQHFNTTTSMGRLTLNVLLSFAQFEREVTGERIRDKVAASKKKGIWMSGKAPIGYILKERKLLIDNEHAPKIKLIFNKYLELKSVQKLIVHLRENNIKTKHGYAFSKGALYHILANKTYVGFIKHKENVYPGEHQPIIDQETFDQVQIFLSQNKVLKKCSINSKHPSLLAGKIFDDKGNYMSPSHSNKNNRRYRYYVSQAIIQSKKHEAGTVSKIPAGEIESFVTDEIKTFLSDTQNIQQYIENYDVHKQKDLLDTINQFQTDLNDKFNNIFIRTVLSKVILYKEKVEIILCKDQLIRTLEAITYNTLLPEESKNGTKNPITITKFINIVPSSKKGSILIISDSKREESHPNPQLIKAITKSYYWNNLFLSGEVKTSMDIQKLENLKDNSYIKDILRLRFLAPCIVETILKGTQSVDLSIQKLFSIRTLDWQEQKELLGFGTL